MNILIKQVTITDPNSSFHQSIKDILIKDGVIVQIEETINNDAATLISHPNLHISPGFFDIGTNIGDPGFENREDFDSAIKAASAGGFTGMAVLPNNQPITDSKSQIEYLKTKTKGSIVDVFALGSITPKAKGETLAELFDMHYSGAIGFTDGLNALQHSGVMLRALQYVLPFNGLILQQPNDEHLSEQGVMNEGESAVNMGSFSIPAIAEATMVQRDLYLTEYANSKIHFFNITTPESIELVKKAKQKGVKVTAGISSLYTLFSDEQLNDFDTNLKLMPPLRNRHQIEAIKNAIADGTIDVLCSWHQPRDTEEKNVEFDHALFGAINLQTCFSAAITSLTNSNLEKIIMMMSIHPREILGLSIPIIEINQTSNLVLYCPYLEYTFEEKNIHSKSKNSPFIHQKLKGKIVGTINNNQLQLN
jgi:dihydroorotase